jgi:hypothetical protein
VHRECEGMNSAKANARPPALDNTFLERPARRPGSKASGLNLSAARGLVAAGSYLLTAANAGSAARQMPNNPARLRVLLLPLSAPGLLRRTNDDGAAGNGHRSFRGHDLGRGLGRRRAGYSRTAHSARSGYEAMNTTPATEQTIATARQQREHEERRPLLERLSQCFLSL